MRSWQRRVTGILTLGGSFLGMALALQYFVQSSRLLTTIFTCIFAAIYCWGIWCGLRLLEQKKDASRSASIFWLLQVPHVMTPVAGAAFSSGASIIAYYNFRTGLGMWWQFGSRFDYSVMETDKPLIIGLNVFALLVALFLGAVSMRPLTTQSSGPPRLD